MENQFTYSYSQPPDYRFCQDSVIFPKLVADLVREQVSQHTRVMDLCAGCGVIGFELAYHLPQIRRIDFLEVQGEFQNHFTANLDLTDHCNHDFRWLEKNYVELLATDEKYDLVLANPPYFFADEGKPSPSPLKNRCRFFMDSDLHTLVKAAFHVLHPTGQAYLLIKSGEKHGRRTREQIKSQLGHRAEVIAEIRGTDVWCFTKPSE